MRKLLGVCVLLMTLNVNAGTERELRKLLEGKVVVYQGTCHLKDGKFAETDVKDYEVFRCIVGVDLNEPGEIYYVLTYERGEAAKLLQVNKDTKVQEVLWKKGSEV